MGGMVRGLQEARVMVGAWKGLQREEMEGPP